MIIYLIIYKTFIAKSKRNSLVWSKWLFLKWDGVIENIYYESNESVDDKI